MVPAVYSVYSSRLGPPIRRVQTRLPSGFHHVHAYKHLGATPEEICEFARRTRIAHAALGTQARMVAGEPVAPGVEAPLGGWPLFGGAPGPPAQLAATAELACARLRRLAFVGLVEHWAASVCLFHAMFGGERRPNELATVRPGRHRAAGGAVQVADCDDAADDRLYACAMALFLQRLARYPHCMVGLDPAQMRAAVGLS